MKPTSPSIIDRRLARHDSRAWSGHACSAGVCFFRPQADPELRQIQPSADDTSRRDFRKMTMQMLADQDRPKAVEIVVYLFVTAIVAWPLISLLMLLAETVPG